MTASSPAPTAVPRTLRVTRERRGLTAKTLAEALGRHPSWVTRAEKGGVKVAGNDLRDYAATLGTTDAFLRETLPEEPAEGAHFRSQTLTQRARNLAVQHANYVGWTINQMIRETDTDVSFGLTLPEYDLDLLDGGPEEAAQLLRALLRLHGPVANVAEILEDAGVFVVPLPAEANKVDAVTVRTDGPVTAVILLNLDRPQARQRHTLAHELAHLVLDHTHGSTRGLKEREENADRFAGEFLAPYLELGTTLRGITPARIDDLQDLRLAWGVSLPALIRRAYNNGDLNESQYRYWFRTLNAMNLLRDKRDVGYPVTITGVQHLIEDLKNADYSPANLCEFTRSTIRELQDTYGDQWPYAPLRTRLHAI